MNNRKTAADSRETRTAQKTPPPEPVIQWRGKWVFLALLLLAFIAGWIVLGRHIQRGAEQQAGRSTMNN